MNTTRAVRGTRPRGGFSVSSPLPHEIHTPLLRGSPSEVGVCGPRKNQNSYQ